MDKSLDYANHLYWQGDKISKAEPKRHPFSFTFKGSDELSKGGRIEICECEDNIPPSRRTANVTPLCTLRFEWDRSYDELEDFVAENGRKLKILNYDIEMVPSGASVVLRAKGHGIELSSRDVQIRLM